MNSNPKVSCIIACFEVDLAELESSVRSVLNQSYENREIVIQNGCMAQNLIEIANLSKQVKVFNEPDDGIYHAFNLALEKTEGDIIHFLGSGDVLCNQDLYRIVIESFFKSQAYMINVGLRRVPSSSKVEKIKNFYYQPEMYQEKKYGRPVVPMHPDLFTREFVFKEVKFDSSYKSAGDIKWMIEVIQKFGMPVGFEIYGVEMQAEGLSSNPRAYEFNVSENLRILADFRFRGRGWYVIMYRAFFVFRRFFIGFFGYSVYRRFADQCKSLFCRVRL